MKKHDLYKKLKEFSYETRAKYVNQVKNDAEEQEYWLLVQLEIEDLLDELNKELLTESNSNKLAMIAARIQGIEMVRKQIFDKWSLK